MEHRRFANWDGIRLIADLGRFGSLNATATALGVNQATLSRQLSRVEAQLGVTLFLRLKSGLVPTASGSEAIKLATELEGQVLDLVVAARRFDDSLSGPLRVSIPFDFMDLGFAETIVSFKALYPDIHIDVSTKHALANLNALEADVVLSALEPSDGMWGYKIAEAVFGYFGTRELFSIWEGDLVTRSKTARIPLIGSSRYPDLGMTNFIEAFPEANVIATGNSIDGILPLLLKGLGFARLPFAVANQVGGLRLIEPNLTPERRNVWILSLAELRQVPKVNCFLEHVRDSFLPLQDMYSEFPSVGKQNPAQSAQKGDRT